MSTAVDVAEPRLLDVRVTDDEIIAYLADGRPLGCPCAACVVLALVRGHPAGAVTFSDYRRRTGHPLAGH